MTHYTVEFKSAVPELGTVGTVFRGRTRGNAVSILEKLPERKTALDCMSGH